MKVLEILTHVLVAGFACFLIGQPTHAAPPGLTQNSNNRWRHDSFLDEQNEFYTNEFVSSEDNPSSIPQSFITETDMTSDASRQKRHAKKKPCPEYDGIDPCLPCHGDESSDTNFTIEIGIEETSDRDKILEDLRTMWGIVDVAQMHTQDLLDGYEKNNRKETHKYNALKRNIKLPKRVKALNNKKQRKLLKNKKNHTDLAKFMREHYDRLSTVYYHLHFIHEDEESLDQVRHSPLLNDTKLLRVGINTLLCQLNVNKWSPPECRKPKIGQICKMYESISDSADRYDRDLIILKYNKQELDDLENALKCLLGESECSRVKKRRNGGNKIRRGRGQNRQGRRKGRKNNKNQNRKKNRAEN